MYLSDYTDYQGDGQPGSDSRQGKGFFSTTSKPSLGPCRIGAEGYFYGKRRKELDADY